ncbi:hypothetical protein AAFF_G00136820 [Aldrovandia affinis]|uniref:Uncharacterized protein n=1 Tax=Aldrovandia affinis TaxID=143900 RepID=A0AAD7X2P0_9TELE|nr:hypothetical protein AAFF_G00136820 [Aldrovandia affinis]
MKPEVTPDRGVQGLSLDSDRSQSDVAMNSRPSEQWLLVTRRGEGQEEWVGCLSPSLLCPFSRCPPR